jgi:hypothetical protein
MLLERRRLTSKKGVKLPVNKGNFILEKRLRHE